MVYLFLGYVLHLSINWTATVSSPNGLTPVAYSQFNTRTWLKTPSTALETQTRATIAAYPM